MPEKFTTVEDKASYAIGRQVGEHLLGHPFKEINFTALMEGLADMVEKIPAQVSEQEQMQALDAINQRLQKQQDEMAAADAARRVEEGRAFLEENAGREGVNVTPSGLQFEVLQEGNGASPAVDSTVTVHYHGTLIDGSVFDSSVDRQEPIDLPVNGVIAGWTEALQMMEEGAKWKLYVPHELAYGERGAGAAIAPCSTLIFEVELLAVL